MNSYSCLKKKKRVFACGEAASQTEVPVRRSRAGTESDQNYANTTSFKGGSNFLLLLSHENVLSVQTRHSGVNNV